MPATVQSILQSAKAEWEHWGKSTWDVAKQKIEKGHTDDEKTFAQYVIDHYCAIGGGNPSIPDIQDDRYFWSAVGMSAIMAGAGLTPEEFRFAQSHSVFIRRFVAARKKGAADAVFWGFRTGEAGGAPEPGDIVAYARAKKMTPAKAAALFDATGAYDSHSDVVVAKHAGAIEVIGCNVMDSVTRKILPLDAKGHIQDDQHFWFAVLKWRGS